MKFIGHVESGRLSCRVNIAEFLKRMEGQKLQVDICKYEKENSTNQKRFFHGPFLKSIQDYYLSCGMDPSLEATKFYVKKYVWRHTAMRELPDGTFEEEVLSIKDLSTSQLEEKLDEARAFYAEKGWALPFPGENMYG